MKKYLLTLSLSFFCLCIPSIAQLDLLDEAFLFYPFNGDCDDYSGNFRHAVGINVVPDTGFDGIPLACYMHNGTSSRINRPHLNLEDTMAFAGWFYSTSNFQNSCLIYNGHSGENGYGIFIKKPFTTYGLGNKIVVVQGGLSENIVDTTFSMPLNEWVHIGMVVKGSYFELYVNGIFHGSGVRPFNPPNGTFSVGMNPEQQAGGFPAFYGRIDEVVVYKKNCDATWMARVYNEGVTTHTSDPFTTRKVEIYPNPVRDKLFIDGEEISRLQIIDSKGASVSSLVKWAKNPNGAEVNISELKSGIYRIILEAKSGPITRQISVN